MNLPIDPPATDPSPIFEAYRGSYGSELLVAAVAHFDVFGQIGGGSMRSAELGARLGLAERPVVVLTTALCAMGLLRKDEGGRLAMTALAAEHLTPGGAYYVGDYVAMSAQSPGVLEMVRRLRSNKPAGTDDGGAGAAFIFRDGLDSAMERQDSARALTLALAGRAKNVAPALAAAVDLSGAWRVLDVAGGTGIYLYAMLRANPALTGVVLDGAEVLGVAGEFAEAAGVSGRVEMVAGDMFADPLPGGCDVILLSNVLHDWDVAECRALVAKCAAALPAGGRLFVHDVFLNDGLDGPLAIALYSAALFTVCEGRAYSAGEYAGWMREAGLETTGRPTPTLVHCGVLEGRKPVRWRNDESRNQ